jgi:phosphatidylethanolamine-binding protein (PEBP) family uncharacterized protein
MPIRFTCDSTATTPPLQWTGAPAGTVSYAVVMHHVAGPGDVHWYWLLYGISAGVTQIAEGATVPTILGNNSVNARNEYAPPCSKGPGQKAYTFTVYALSKAPTFAVGTAVTRDALLAAIATNTLGSSSMTVTYERPANATNAASQTGAGAAPQGTRPPRLAGSPTPAPAT